jgi:peptidoglycan/LPS O-acetylase OafA/YrhL
VIVAMGAPRHARAAPSRTGVAYLGRISYGTYLWHWPIIEWCLTRKIDPGGIWFFVLIAVLSTCFAAIGFHLLERRSVCRGRSARSTAG